MIESDRQPWHLDKRIPLALIGAILVQTGAAFWWASSINERVGSLETWRSDTKSIAADIASIKASMQALKDSVDDVKDRLNGKRLEFQHNGSSYRPRPGTGE